MCCRRHYSFALRGRIISHSAELGLPVMYQWPETADDGGLITYDPNLLGAFRQVAALVVEFLQGAKPGELHEQRNNFLSLLT